MKRSEMEEIITNTIKNSTSFPIDNLIANYILNEIENAGMLPPTYTYWNKDKNGNLKHSIWNGRDINQWESEDG